MNKDPNKLEMIKFYLKETQNTVAKINNQLQLLDPDFSNEDHEKLCKFFYYEVLANVDYFKLLMDKWERGDKNAD